MASTNVAITHGPVLTHEGGNASRINSEQMLKRSVMASMLWEDSFYEDGESIADRIFRLTQEIGKEKASIILDSAKFESKLRHVPLWMLIAMAEKGWVDKELVNKICTRADDMPELLSLYWKNGKKPLSSQLQKGLALSFKKFNEYELAKYNRDKAIKLRDVMRIVHPKPDSKEQSELFKRVLDGTLETPDTWEVAISACKSEEEKKKEFERLLSEKKIGDLAFVRNLRKMTEVKVDTKLIKSSFEERKWKYILPFQFITSARYNPHLEPMLESAMLSCLSETPKYDGDVAILVDVSGSMSEPISAKSETRRIDVASGLAILAKETFTNVEFYSFTSDFKVVPARKGFALRDAIGHPSGSTKMWKAISSIGASKKRKIMIVITDEETTDSGTVSQANCDLLVIVNISSSEKGVGYEKGSIHINGWSENVITYLMEYIKYNGI